jgi:methyl-accepting chemotaxis protein
MSVDLTSALPAPEAELHKNQAPRGATFRASPALLLCVLALPGVAASAWLGGWAGSAVATLAACALAWGWAHHQGSSLDAGASIKSPQHAADSASLSSMVHQVVPAWREQIGVSRTTNQDGMAELLSTFSTISGMLNELHTLFAECEPNVAPGAVGQAIEAQRPAINALLEPIERAFRQRDALLDQLAHCTTAAARLQQLSKEVRSVGAHTRLVAFNASIEANRGQASQLGGQSSVAAEIRTLSEKVVALCDQFDERLRPLYEACRHTHQEGLMTDTTVEELRLEAELKARQALHAVLQSLGASVGGAAKVQNFSRDLNQHMELMFTHFQFGDRVEQMLDIIGKDMNRFVAFTQENPQPTALDVQNWLKQLEKSYTMSEQRSQHHGTEHVNVGSQVDFF